MRINDSNPQYLRPDQLKAGQTPATEVGSRTSAQPIVKVDRADKVTISDAGRNLSAIENEKSSLSPERLTELRTRVLDGAYDSLEVVELIARRILATGDV